MSGRAKLVSLAWVRLSRTRRRALRQDLLARRLREYFEARSGSPAERFHACREEVIFNFQLRGYPVEEVDEALGRLTRVGVLQETRGWYCLSEPAARIR